ncbi:hypothetical protein [Aliamphritea spongicola]|uniref:hypothetical protein n=1 Tax=Aliamphritea spongicola TaxID=707589 RepID=UPI00196A7F8B|nr:hypothetical protein [Aliamphritea spongicola]MBN3561341.1 hypothetical protein [Aliamphritea spongicola]
MLNKGTVFAAIVSAGAVTQVSALESKLNGVIDYRLAHSDTSDSYRQGGVGKFGTDNGGQAYLGQAGLQWVLEWDSGLSFHTVANGYYDGEDNGLGITESFFRYRGIPNESGHRLQSKVGLFYPAISLENKAFAWAAKNTLNSSTLNTWIGEEIRLLGAELTWTRLGKLNDAGYDLSFTASGFFNNDPTGALLAWHGWTSSSRQTLWGEKRKIPPLEARQSGFKLEPQAAESDPFLELDDRPGYHLQTQVRWSRQGEINAGYYNNNARTDIVEHGQYTWLTRFYYVGARWLLDKKLELTAQYMTGDTLMNDVYGRPVVDNDYRSAFLMLSKRVGKHRFTGRIEEFSVTDKDQTAGDNNDEYGTAATLNYTYRYSKPLFLSVEHTWINSDRPGRVYAGEPADREERQLLLAVRYFF